MIIRPLRGRGEGEVYLPPASLVAIFVKPLCGYQWQYQM
jgi:hypothetical protein